MDQLKFFNLVSAIDVGFWQVLAKEKLERIKLSTADIPIWGYYMPSGHTDLPAMLRVGTEAMNMDGAVPNGSVRMRGILKLFNTLEGFRGTDRDEILSNSGDFVWEGDEFNNFVLLAFADLKSYVFHYWFGMPIINFPPLPSIKIPLDTLVSIDQLKVFMSANVNSLQPVFPVKVENLEIVNKNFNDFEFLIVMDPASSPAYPASPLRNIISKVSRSRSDEFLVLLVKDPISFDPSAYSLPHTTVIKVVPPTELKPQFVGWELNNQNKLQPKSVDLRPQLDPNILASSALELNLKLMRWRMLPEVNLEIIANSSCLLLGAGTLGSQLSRNLLAWGVRKITFVDSARVSYSNPARQSLYEFEDAKLSAFKAEVAADKLKKIDPSVNAQGFAFRIPMPGHSINANREEMLKSFEKLKNLIDEHDVVFLLLDSREARWLGSVISAASDKMCLSVGLGFDSFLVIRHQNDGLGCYFCSDIVAPRNSLVDRTLDQMCTVTRPGLSYQASAVASELYVAMLQHPLKQHAEHDADTCLSKLPHQIRGTFSNFSIQSYKGTAFSKCTACSVRIREEFLQGGFEFVEKVCNQPEFLEEICELNFIDDVNEDDLIEIDDLD